MIDDNVNYDSTEAQRAAVAAVNLAFASSKRYWNTKHETQKRLYRRYLNDDVKGARPGGYSDERTGMFYRCADILHSVIADVELEQSPIGKMRGTGEEDNEAREVIDRVHGYQQQSTTILNTLDQAILQAVITCGVIMPGWDHHSEIYWRDVPKTMTLADPQNPMQPMEIPTGEIERKPFSIDISRLDATLVEPWNVYPTAGATTPLNAHEIIIRVPLSRNTLKIMERSGHLKNVDKIPESDYGQGSVVGDMIDDTPIYQARKEDAQSEIGGKPEYIWVNYCFMLFPYYKYPENMGDVGYSEDEFECLLIKTEGSHTVLKFDVNELSAKPCVVVRYAGDTFFGFSALEIAERMIQLDEDMFNWTMDRAKREVYRRIFVASGINQSKVANPGLDSVIEFSTTTMMSGGKPVWTEPSDAHVMLNLQKQREIVYQLIDEITMILYLISGQTNEATKDESATMTNSKMQFVTKRLKNRLKYFERNGLWWWMQWQTILNCQFLTDEEVAKIANIPPALNPFKIITPTLPIQTYDFAFEGSVKAIDDPVKAQILKDLLKTAMGLPPGIGSDGRLKQPNLMWLYEEILKHSNVTDDMDKAFIETTPEQAAMSAGGGGGNTPLGAVTPADVAAGTPKANSGVRKEMT